MSLIKKDTFLIKWYWNYKESIRECTIHDGSNESYSGYYLNANRLDKTGNFVVSMFVEGR